MNHAYFGYRSKIPGLTFSAQADTLPNGEGDDVEWSVNLMGYISGLCFDVDVFCLPYMDGIRREIRAYLEREIRSYLDEYLRQNWTDLRSGLMDSLRRAYEIAVAQPEISLEVTP